MRGRRLTALSVPDQRHLGLGLIGLLSLGSAAVSSLLSERHAVLCGTELAPHCAWCATAAAFAVLGAAALAAAAVTVQPRG